MAFSRTRSPKDHPRAHYVVDDDGDERYDATVAYSDDEWDDDDGDWEDVEDNDRSSGSGFRKLLGWGLLAAGVGYGVMVWRDKGAERAPYMLDAEDGDYSIRRYPELIVAQTTQPGTLDQSVDRGYRRLADYIGAKNRPGEKIAMVAPVLVDSAEAVAGDARWRTRFVMPSGWTQDRLPTPSGAVSLGTIDRRRVAAVRFTGAPGEAEMKAKERELRNWIERRGETASGEAEYAYYHAPYIPPLARRNEVLIPLA